MNNGLILNLLTSSTKQNPVLSDKHILPDEFGQLIENITQSVYQKPNHALNSIESTNQKQEQPIEKITEEVLIAFFSHFFPQVDSSVPLESSQLTFTSSDKRVEDFLTALKNLTEIKVQPIDNGKLDAIVGSLIEMNTHIESFLASKDNDHKALIPFLNQTVAPVIMTSAKMLGIDKVQQFSIKNAVLTAYELSTNIKAKVESQINILANPEGIPNAISDRNNIITTKKISPLSGVTSQTIQKVVQLSQTPVSTDNLMVPKVQGQLMEASLSDKVYLSNTQNTQQIVNQSSEQENIALLNQIDEQLAWGQKKTASSTQSIMAPIQPSLNTFSLISKNREFTTKLSILPEARNGVTTTNNPQSVNTNSALTYPLGIDLGGDIHAKRDAIFPEQPVVLSQVNTKNLDKIITFSQTNKNEVLGTEYALDTTKLIDDSKITGQKTEKTTLNDPSERIGNSVLGVLTNQIHKRKGDQINAQKWPKQIILSHQVNSLVQSSLINGADFAGFNLGKNNQATIITNEVNTTLSILTDNLLATQNMEKLTSLEQAKVSEYIENGPIIETKNGEAVVVDKLAMPTTHRHFQSTLPMYFASEAWQSAFTKQAIFLTKQGIQSAELKLHPEELGAINIQLAVDDNLVKLQIYSANSHVRSVMEHTLNHLKASFSEQGYELSDSFIGSDNQNSSNKDENESFFARNASNQKQGRNLDENPVNEPAANTLSHSVITSRNAGIDNFI